MNGTSISVLSSRTSVGGLHGQFVDRNDGRSSMYGQDAFMYGSPNAFQIEPIQNDFYEREIFGYKNFE